MVTPHHIHVHAHITVPGGDRQVVRFPTEREAWDYYKLYREVPDLTLGMPVPDSWTCEACKEEKTI